MQSLKTLDLRNIRPFYMDNSRFQIMCHPMPNLLFKEYVLIMFIFTHLLQLLDRDSSTRLGSHGIVQLKQHPFFKGFDWGMLLSQEMEAPFVPELNGPLDLSYFDPNITRCAARFSQLKRSLSGDEQDLFKTFEWSPQVQVL